MRAITRIMGVSINTVSKLLRDAGEACDIYSRAHIRNVIVSQLQLDEQWSFCYAKDKTVNRNRIKGDPDYAGSVWLWTAFDPESKLIVSWAISDARDVDSTVKFVNDVASRMNQDNPIQISSDGFNPYHAAISKAFERKIDYARVVKQYETNGQYKGSKKVRLTGRPDRSRISMSLIERHNLTTRMSLRRYNRKTNAHSKSIEYHYLSLGLYMFWYNFIRVHSTIGTTPAVRAGISNVQYDFEDVLGLIDALEVVRKYESALSE